jgi:hypothetical protein
MQVHVNPGVDFNKWQGERGRRKLGTIRVKPAVLAAEKDGIAVDDGVGPDEPFGGHGNTHLKTHTKHSQTHLH